MAMMMLLVLAAACGSGNGDDDATLDPAPLQPMVQEGPVWTARIQVIRQVAPHWVGADLPARFEDPEADPGRWPPWGTYAARICSGRDTLRDAWRRRLISSDGVSWSRLAAGCGSRELCAWLDDRGAKNDSAPQGLALATMFCANSAAASVEVPAELAGNAAPLVWMRKGALDHEATLGRIASLVRLPRVGFRAVVPDRRADRLGRRPRTILYAWADGARFRILADDGGAMFGVGQHVGLVNALLAHRGESRRIAVAEADSGWLAVAGEPLELEGYAASGVVRWAPVPLPRVAPLPERWRGEWHANDDVDTGFVPDAPVPDPTGQLE